MLRSLMASFAKPPYLGAWCTAKAPQGYTKPWFRHEGVAAHAFVVRAVETGFIICVPPPAVPEETLQQATADQYTGVFGPWTATAVRAVSVTGRELQRTLPCLLLDLNASAINMLSEEADAGEPVTFGVHRLQSVWPAPHAAVAALETFLNSHNLVVEGFERLEGYYTVASDGEGALGPTAATQAASPQVGEPTPHPGHRAAPRAFESTVPAGGLGSGGESSAASGKQPHCNSSSSCTAAALRVGPPSSLQRGLAVLCVRAKCRSC